MSGLEVIGAGFGRTGTLSLYTALNILDGTSPCYHMLENFKWNHKSFWFRANEATTMKERERALKEVLTDKGYKAIVDFPGCVFYEDLMRMSPNAKVILSVRDSSTAWFKSVDKTIFAENTGGRKNFLQMLFPFGLHRYVIRPLIWLPFADFFRMEQTIERMFRGAPKDYSQAGMEKCYSDWLEHVKSTVPKDRLLIHNAKEGWKPICDFLGKPVPDCPYPRVNDTGEFQRKMLIGDAISIVSIAAFYGGLFYAAKYANTAGFFDSAKKVIIDFLQ